MSNVIIPMAGAGSRFSNAGYQHPKPFIPIKGRPMIEHVIDNITTPQDKIYLLGKLDHLEYLKDSNLLTRRNISIIPVLNRTEGAACTVLLARQFINNDEPLTIVNSDQYVIYNRPNWELSKLSSDSLIMTFKANHPKWSYALTHPNTTQVVKVAEKEVISEHATVGIYWFKKGSDFVNSAEEMIHKNIRVNNEFYVTPSINQMLNKNINIFPVEQMFGLGTPEDLEANYEYVGI